MWLSCGGGEGESTRRSRLRVDDHGVLHDMMKMLVPRELGRRFLKLCYCLLLARLVLAGHDAEEDDERNE